MIYLASASARRQELLRQLGVAFEVLPSQVPEVRDSRESPSEYVRRVAHDKAHRVALLIQERGMSLKPILGADTEVVLDNEVLGKPENAAHGKKMLQQLSGRTHEVFSAVCLRYRDKEYSALSTSRVTFRAMTAAEIEQYWETGEPSDKAGAYAIQGRAAAFIESLEGSYSGVMGLPLFEVSELLHKMHADIN